MTNDNNKLIKFSWCGSSKQFFRIIVNNSLCISDNLYTYFENIWNDDDYDETDCECVVGKLYLKSNTMIWVLDENDDYENNVVIADWNELCRRIINFEDWFNINTQGTEDDDNTPVKVLKDDIIDDVSELDREVVLSIINNEEEEEDEVDEVDEEVEIEEEEEEIHFPRKR